MLYDEQKSIVPYFFWFQFVGWKCNKSHPDVFPRRPVFLLYQQTFGCCPVACPVRCHCLRSCVWNNTHVCFGSTCFTQHSLSCYKSGESWSAILPLACNQFCSVTAMLHRFFGWESKHFTEFQAHYHKHTPVSNLKVCPSMMLHGTIPNDDF